MSAVADRLNFSTVHGVELPLRPVSLGCGAAGAETVAVVLSVVVFLRNADGLNRSKIEGETVPALTGLVTSFRSCTDIVNLSSTASAFRAEDACVLKAATNYVDGTGDETDTGGG